MPPTPISKPLLPSFPSAEFPSGPGKILVSPGAEEFDPESMLDLEDRPASSPPQERRQNLSTSKPLVALTLCPSMADKMFEVAGILHGLTSDPDKFTLRMECLGAYALRMAEFSSYTEKPAFIECEVSMGEEAAANFGMQHFELTSVSIESFDGVKAITVLQFACKQP